MHRAIVHAVLIVLLIVPDTLAKPVGHALDAEGVELHEIDSGSGWKLYEQVDVAKGASFGDSGNATFVVFLPPALQTSRKSARRSSTLRRRSAQ